jgi:SnoaL-like polyketide cyclase
MSQAIVEKTAQTEVQQNMESYFKTHDAKFVATNAVFINMGTGERTEGREAVAEMLHYIYHVAFDAVAEITNWIITDRKALLEANFKGRHIAEFAGIPATNKEVNVPFSIAYDLENGLIKEARIYMLGDVMFKQLGM